MTQAISSEGWFERLIAAVLRAVLRATLRPTFRAGRPIPEQRRRLELITRLTLPARGVDYCAASLWRRPRRVRPRSRRCPGLARDSLPARRRLLRRFARHSPLGHESSGTQDRREHLRCGLSPGPGASVSCRRRRCDRSLSWPARAGLGARSNCIRRRFRGRRPDAVDRAQVAGAGRTPACRACAVFTLGRSWQSGPRPTAAR